jgi:glycosidase
MAVKLQTVLSYAKGGELTAATAADQKRTQALVNPSSVGDLPADEFSRVKARAAHFAEAAGKPAAQAQITGIWTEADKGGLPRVRFQGPGQQFNVFMSVKISGGDPKSVVPELWTNTNHLANPSDFEAYPMELVSQNGDTATYKATLNLQTQGNFRITGRVSTSGNASSPNWKWAEDTGVQDVRFRPRAVQNENVSEMVVHVGLANSDGTNISTFRDLMDGKFGEYNIDAVKAAGKNTIRLQPPFRHDRWDHADPYDSLGSPYATTDFFTIDPRYSRDAQEAIKNGSVQSWDADKLRQLANNEFFEFVQAAHAKGVRVVMDIALNHTGHNTTVRDLFDDPAKGEIVVRSNFDNITLDTAQTQAVHDRIAANPNGTGEQLFPELFANKNHDPAGAHSISDMIGGGNGEWADTKQLNTGAFNWGGEIHDTQINRNVTDWHARILAFWANPPPSETGGKKVDGVDGYRNDHSTNLPPEDWERSENQAQALVDKPLITIQEDFNQQERLRVYGDAMESGWYKDLINDFKTSNVDGIWGIVGSDYFYETLRGGNHDEERIINQFGGDMMASGRYLAMLDLFGGISTTLMGDEFGEGKKLEFKHVGAVPPTLVEAKNNALPKANVDLQQAMKRAGEAKNNDPSLKTLLRTRLFANSNESHILGMARHADDRSVPGTLVFANLANGDTMTNTFMLDDETKSRIDPNGMYEVKDEMSAQDRSADLWPNWIKGSDLINNGVFVKLSPYQIQALKIEKRG